MTVEVFVFFFPFFPFFFFFPFFCPTLFPFFPFFSFFLLPFFPPLLPDGGGGGLSGGGLSESMYSCVTGKIPSVAANVSSTASRAVFG